MAFISLARASRNFGEMLDFDARVWDVTDFVACRKGVPARSGLRRIGFNALRSGPSGPAEPMPAPVGTFMRAFVRQLPRVGHARMEQFIRAGTHIAEAMLRFNVRAVSDCNAAVLDEAIRIANTRYTRRVAQDVSFNVQRIALFLDQNGMVHAPLASWRSSSSIGKPIPERSSTEFEVRSARLLPSDAFLDLLAKAYHLAAHPTDVIVTRVAAILSAAPERINEVLALEEHPEVERNVRGKCVLGLRWRGSKQYPDTVKLVPSAMAPVVRDSLTTLRLLTEEGRRIKRWYDRNEREVYLPPQLEYLRGKPRLSMAELGALLGLPVKAGLYRYVKQARIELLPATEGVSSAAVHNVSFASFQYYILSHLPARMRDAGGIITHPLLILPWRTFKRRGGGCPCMFEIIQRHHIARGLKPGRTRKSVFQRLGLDPGGVVAGRTHSLRHWLETQAVRGGLSESDRAVWACRADTRHNRFYDHRSGKEMRDLVGKANASSARTTSPLARPEKVSASGGTGTPAQGSSRRRRGSPS